MFIRKYVEKDLEGVLKLFYETVHSINAKDYDKKQLDVWAPVNIDRDKWRCSLKNNYAIIAEFDDNIIGFADITDDGYLDRMYVHREYQSKGIASSLLFELEQHLLKLGVNKIETYASITAKGFFESQEFKVLFKNKLEKDGISLINYKMIKLF